MQKIKTILGNIKKKKKEARNLKCQKLNILNSKVELEETKIEELKHEDTITVCLKCNSSDLMYNNIYGLKCTSCGKIMIMSRQILKIVIIIS